MASHYLAIVLITCALYSVGGIEARQGPLPTLTSVTNGEGLEDFPSSPMDIDPPGSVKDEPLPGSNVLLESGPIPVHAVSEEPEPPPSSDVLPELGPILVHTVSEEPEPPPSSDVLPELGPIPVHGVSEGPEPPPNGSAYEEPPPPGPDLN
ncbi:leucine-rich repeat extensin-like protein 3 [Syzygium oleosum]|uniref:leucine-rich repeat extensin-like protein 3 n=1 Tax=Syzygium oleosum TaxID=219896 RepID=UPI0024BAE279|nr:leucine-rich repeat extensin-like protein 3 [Syzygium oleosum]